MKNKVIILAGPGGVGKSTISQYLCSHFSDRFQESVSCTTREKRSGEKDGVHYYFLSEKEFSEKIKENQFLEYNLFPNGNMYGTLFSEVERILKTKNCILVIDVLTGLSIAERYPDLDVVTFFLDVDDDSLMKRLKGRGDNESAIMQRLLVAHEERKMKGKCDYCLISDNIEKVANVINSLV